MTPCKHLDYDGNYSADLVDGASAGFPGVRWWVRRLELMPDPSAPRKVQFCKLRGRINDVFSCYGERSCFEGEDAVEEMR